MSGRSPVSGQSILEGKSDELIAALTAAVQFKADAKVRIAGLKCLAAVKNLPYNLLHPSVRTVNKTLLQCLDDPRRAVRFEAGKTRRQWNPV